MKAESTVVGGSGAKLKLIKAEGGGGVGFVGKVGKGKLEAVGGDWEDDECLWEMKFSKYNVQKRGKQTLYC